MVGGDSSGVSFTQLKFGYRTDGAQVDVLDSVTASVPEGEFLAFVGPSGCGKTTLLKLTADLIPPREAASKSGSVSISGMTPSQARRSRMLGFVFQDAVLFPWRSVIENVLLPCDVMGKGRAQSEDKALHLLQRAGLGGFADANPWELSGGMQQRVSLVRAMMTDPKILLLDEPFAGLDELLKEEFFEAIQTLSRESNATVLLVTHDLFDAVALCDQVVVLSPRPAHVQGRVDVALPRPRVFDHRLSRDYSEAVSAVRAALSSGARMDNER